MIAEIIAWVATVFRGAGMLAKSAEKMKCLIGLDNLFWMLNGIMTCNVPLIVSNGFCNRGKEQNNGLNGLNGL